MAIRLADEIEREGRPATVEEQAQLIRFTGFGASELANGIFRRPGETTFRKGWEETGAALEEVGNRLKALKLTIRNAPLAQPASYGACIFTGAPAVEEILIARAY